MTRTFLRLAVWCSVLATAGTVVHLSAVAQSKPPATAKPPAAPVKAAASAKAPAAPAAAPDLETLYETHQLFELRDALKAPGAPPFFKAAVAAAFNATTAEKDLRAVIKADAQSAEANEARALLIAMFERTGRFADAARELNALVAAQPDAAGTEDAAALFGVFAKHPAQTISGSGPVAISSSVVNGGVFVPITINGVAATYLVDTTASISRLSGLEARRAGLQIERAVTREVDQESGAPIYMRMAVADRLTIGGMELQNVAFLVVNDDEKPFSDLAEGQRGAIGLPVLTALRNIRWSADGKFEAAFPSTSKATTRPNICFDGLTPLTEAALGTDKFSLVLDTGATVTELWPFFAHQFTSLLKSGTKGTERENFVSGRVQVPIVQLASVPLRIGGREMPVGPVKVMMQSTEPLWYHGRLGLDALSHAKRVTIDFQRLQLSVE